MGTKKKTKAEPVETSAADQPALAVGMIWTDPRDGQKYNVVAADGKVSCKGCHFFDTEADCPESDSEGTPVCEGTALGEKVKLVKIGAITEPAPKAKAKAKKAKPETSPAVPIIAGMPTRQLEIPAANLYHAEWNKRGEIQPEDVADLVASIKAVGLIQRVIVREGPLGGCYTILAGHRRFKACKLAGLDPIPCEVVECDEKKAHMITAVENMHRANLTPMQEAEVVEDLIAAGYTAEEIAEQTAWNLRRVYRRASITKLVPEWRNIAHKNGLCAAFLEEVSRLPGTAQKSLEELVGRSYRADEILGGGGDVCGINRFIADMTMDLAKAPWAKKHPDWCANCERCSTANVNLFDEAEVGKGGKCLDKPCWQQKGAALVEELQAKLKEKHGEVRTATGEAVRYDRVPDAKGRKDKTHSVPVVVTDGDDAGKVLWVAGAADKAAAKERGETVPGSKQPSLEEKRKAWVVRKVRDMISDSLKDGGDNPFMRFSDWNVIKTVSLTGTEHSSSWHRAQEWGASFDNQTDAEMKAALWGRVAPVLIARMNYPTITDCDRYYAEAVAQALWFFSIDKETLDAEAAEAIKDKSKKGAE
jgi:ParB family chromosome partitioning protein